jgi:ABC-type Mn2+/Zn2+ transport system permease subunit
VNVASGPAIVLVATLLFLLAWIYAVVKKRIYLGGNDQELKIEG